MYIYIYIYIYIYLLYYIILHYIFLKVSDDTDFTSNLIRHENSFS